MNEQVSVSVASETEVEDNMLSTSVGDTIKTAANNLIGITSIEISQHSVEDENGNHSTVYEAHLTGRGI